MKLTVEFVIQIGQLKAMNVIIH